MSARIVVTGGSGFLGSLLARRLLGGPVALGGAAPADVAELTLVDLVAAARRRRRRRPRADRDRAARRVLLDLGEADAVFHLAGVVSGAAEADFDLGMRTNIDGTRAVLEYGRRHAVPPLVVFTSSLAVFGSDPAIGPVGDVDDDTLPRPQSSYGIQKFVGEQLVADYTRKGFVRGRSVRLMTVSVRPGPPNAAASGFLSGIIREPLAGRARPVPGRSGHPGGAVVAPAQPGGHPAGGRGRRRDVGQPDRADPPGAHHHPPRDGPGPGPGRREAPLSDLIDWVDDPAVGRIVGSWPARFHTPRAHALGLRAEASFDDIVREYVAADGGA